MLPFPRTGLRFQVLNLPEEIDFSRETADVGLSEFDLALGDQGEALAHSRNIALLLQELHDAPDIESGARDLGPRTGPRRT